MNFLDALNVRVGDIEKPALLPIGTYIWSVSKAPKTSASKDGKWSTLEFPCVPKMPYEDAEDVDPEELASYGDLKQGVNSIRFMVDMQAEGDVAMQKFLFNVKRFLLDTLCVEGDEDSTIKELMAKCVGCEFIAQAAHRTDQERGETFCDVKNFAPLT